MFFLSCHYLMFKERGQSENRPRSNQNGLKDEKQEFKGQYTQLQKLHFVTGLNMQPANQPRPHQYR